jgi:GT2 family glycosyltransferase
MVYVDSGSTDGSVEFAKSVGVQVHALDTSIPFTMARGRNTGFQTLLAANPDVRFVQFVDGDCEVDASWIATARHFIETEPEVAIVCGFRRERFPEASVYNRLCDLEWQGPVGDVAECGGDAMHRVEAFRKVNGFNETMIAGEEPELCVRLRSSGYRIVRLEQPMTLHDAAIFEFAQWWKRTVRSGHAFAEGFALHGMGPFHHNRKQLLSSLFYGLTLPSTWLSVVAIGTLPGLGILRTMATLASLGLVSRAAYGAFSSRLARGDDPNLAAIYAAFCMLGKVPEAQGALRFAWTRVLGRRSGLIEYKKSDEAASAPEGGRG